jgi:nucleoside-diphosphate-sugar epimerase
MRVAITGASGFVGHHVIAELAKRDIEIVAVLRPASALPASLSDPTGRISVVRVDLHDPAANPFEDMGAPDVVMHLAWGGLQNYKSLHHFETELPAQYRFLCRLIRAGLGTLLVTGTCFEYGMQSGALGEDMEVRPGNPYGFAKDALRRELEYLKGVHPFSLLWARLFYMHGEGQAPNSLLPQLQRAVERGEPVFNMSGGEQLRDYLPVTEVACHLVTLALAQRDVGVINVCSGRPISVRKLVENWQKERGSQIALNLGHYPYADYEPMAFWGNRSRLDQIVGAS